MSLPRTVMIEKNMGDRLGVGLADAPGKGIIVSELHSWSELAGLVEVGDKILSLYDLPLSSAKSAAHIFRDSAELRLSVVTPAALNGSMRVDLNKPSRSSDTGISFERDSSTGLARVRCRFHDVEGGGPASGDIVVGIAFGGVAYEITSPKQATAKLREAPAGNVQLILVRAEVRSWSPRSSPSRSPTGDSYLANDSEASEASTLHGLDGLAGPSRIDRRRARIDPGPPASVASLTSMLEHCRGVTEDIRSSAH